MAIPFLIAGVAAALGATGIAKGAAALSDINKAKDIGNSAERRHRKKLRELDEIRQQTNNQLARLGKLKVDIFVNQIKHVVTVIENSSSKLNDFNESVLTEELPQLANLVNQTFELEKGLTSGVASGALVGLGAYSSVGLLATASTGTAISTLSGAAATNATLAWLGGGSLASGGLGIAGGSIVLGGIVAGPALAVTGFILASNAEEALTEATRYSSNIDLKIAKLDALILELEGVNRSAQELQYALLKAVSLFDTHYKQVSHSSSKKEIAEMLRFTKELLKPMLDEAIIKQDGAVSHGILTRYAGQLNLNN